MSTLAQTEPDQVNTNDSRGVVLIVESSADIAPALDSQLRGLGYKVLSAGSGKDAIGLLTVNSVDLVLMEPVLPDMHGSALIRHIKSESSQCTLPVVVMLEQAQTATLTDIMSAGADDFLFKPFSTVALDIRLASVERMRELRDTYTNTTREQYIARQILAAALSTRNAIVKDIRVLSKSAEVFSGDLVLSARHPDGGLMILLADFTGHGLSAAVGILPVADAFSAMTEKGFPPNRILHSINEKLLVLLPTDMFMAACVLKIDADLEHASIWNGGMPDIYLLDHGTGQIKHQLISDHLPLGIAHSDASNFIPETIDINTGDHFIMHSDGLTDAVNPSGEMFGLKRLRRLIHQSTGCESVFPSIVSAFEAFCENMEPPDDVTLVNIPCYKTVINAPGLQ